MTEPTAATTAGTQRFARRFPNVAPGHFRTADGWTCSSLGIGTFGGRDDEETDRGYAAAIARALALGCNVIDTAVAYRNQRSERTVGQTLHGLMREGNVRRDEVVLSSKAGFIPFDSTYPGTVRDYVLETFATPGILDSDEIVAPGHSLAPRFIRHQIDTSLRNLQCAAIDIYYLHNPETQLREITRQEFRRRLTGAFDALERAVADNVIGVYGVSSWSGFRVAPGAKDYLSLDDVLHCASEVGGEHHHFRAIMLPLNLAMPEGVAMPNQQMAGSHEPASVVHAAHALGLMLMAGSTLHRGRLAQQKPFPAEAHPDLNDRRRITVHQALQFTRSAPGLTTALVGMSDPRHVAENLAIAAVPPLSERQFAALLARDTTAPRVEEVHKA